MITGQGGKGQDIPKRKSALQKITERFLIERRIIMVCL
jgi:hypothetical protein